MEVTFQPGLESLVQRVLERKRDSEARKGETVWEAYLRRKRCAPLPCLALLPFCVSMPATWESCPAERQLLLVDSINMKSA